VVGGLYKDPLVLVGSLVSSGIYAVPDDELVNLSHAAIWRAGVAAVNRGVWFRKAIWSYFLILLVRGTRLQGISSGVEPDSNMGWNQIPRDKSWGFGKGGC
jgi:hypothetical protein